MGQAILTAYKLDGVTITEQQAAAQAAINDNQSEVRKQTHTADGRKLPHMAIRKSIKVPLKKGETYHYCTCGLSKSQPFCDGSHEGTGYQPLAFTAEREMPKAKLCGCKYNKPKSGPFCDKQHKYVDW